MPTRRRFWLEKAAGCGLIFSDCFLFEERAVSTGTYPRLRAA
jgi:hypothetical protein